MRGMFLQIVRSVDKKAALVACGWAGMHLSCIKSGPHHILCKQYTVHGHGPYITYSEFEVGIVSQVI